MIPILLLLGLLVAPLRAELSLLYLDASGMESPIGNRITAPDTVEGEFSDVLLRVRNTGSTNDSISAFYVRGTGFSLRSVPGLPLLLVPGANLDVRLRFQPTGSGSFSGTLYLNETPFLITARSPASATLWYDHGGWRQASNSAEIDFGRILSGSTSTILFAFRNPSPASVRVSNLVLAPGPFTLINASNRPLDIPPNAEVQFSIQFTPTRGGVFRANLLVDNRTFVLAGNAYEPPLPEMTLSFPSAEYTSGRQQALHVRFAEPTQGNAVVRLTLAFEPLNGAPDDPAVQFLANGARSLTFEVRTGAEALLWNGDPNLIFQTGTTAGAIRFAVTHELTNRTAEFVIPPAPPYLEAVSVVRTVSALSVQLKGFDNTRSMNAVAFTWYHRDGSIIGGTPIVSVIESIMANYFRTYTFGTGWVAQFVFPVSGAPENVAALEMEAFNSAGSTQSQRVTF